MKSKSDKIKLIIIIIELIILIGLSSYRIYEFVDNSKEEIKENEEQNKQEEDKDNTFTEEQTKDKIKILVYQINIRKEANENSEDVGDVLFEEVYEVLEIIETNDYRWYKINKNGIIGYVANKDGEKWVDYSNNGQFLVEKKYNCRIADCEVYDNIDYTSLVYEKDKYFIYDSITEGKQYLNIDEIKCNSSKKLLEYENKLYGVYCSSGGFQGGGFYYSLNQDKVLYNGYDIEIKVSLPFIISTKHWDSIDGLGVGGPMYYYYKNHKTEIIDFRNNDVVQVLDGTAYLREEKINNIKYYVSMHTGTIYDNNYKLIENVKFNSYKEIGCWEATHWSSSRCSQVNYLINNNNTLTVINGNKYLIYDENMKEIYRSDEYDQIYLIKDYVITIKDIKMYIFDLSGKIVKEFKLINEDSEIITGVLHDKNDIEIFKIAIGDNYYYYIPSTGESGIKLLEY